MSATTDVREWAKAKGIDIKEHGRIPAKVRDQYNAEQAGLAEAEYPDPGADEYDGAVTVADFPPEPEPEEPAADLGHPAETRPRKITAPRSGRGIVAKLRDPAAADGKARRPGKKLSLTGLIEDAWSQMAWAAAPIPPLQRLLWVQAPYAGIALEDALRDTVADRMLQPVARAEAKAEAVGGVVMPPVALLLVLATAPAVEMREVDGQQVVTSEPPSVQHKSALIGLRWALMLMIKSGRVHAEEYAQRIAASQELGRQADEMMAMILGVQLPEQGPVREEEEAVRRAQAMFGGEQ